MKIFKYTFDHSEKMVFGIPQNAVFLAVAEQFGKVAMWFQCHVPDGEWTIQQRTFQVFCTGKEIEQQSNVYLGTFQSDGGKFVGHVFEVILSA